MLRRDSDRATATFDGPSLAANRVRPTRSLPQPDLILSVVAHSRLRRVDVYRSRSTERPFVTLSNPTEVGAPLVFLVTEEIGDWVKVLLPQARAWP